MDSKSVQAMLIDPMNAPEPSAETGPSSHFRSTFGKNGLRDPSSPSPSLHSTPHDKSSASKHAAPSGNSPSARSPYHESNGSDHQGSGSRRRAGSHGVSSSNNNTPSDGKSGRRRVSSLRERYPGDESHKPLDIIRGDSKKASRSHHLHKHSMPGADTVDRLDPGIGGIAYHHEGPYDATLLSRNRNPKHAPLAALEASNNEALKATPRENIRDAVERHQPLDGVAQVPPGVPDNYGRTYTYEEGADMMREPVSDAGYKRWAGQDYADDDLKGHSEPTFSLDRALRAQSIEEDGIEMDDRTDRAGKGTASSRDPVEIAGGEGKYADLEIAEMRNGHGHSIKSGKGSLKKRIGHLLHHNDD